MPEIVALHYLSSHTRTRPPARTHARLISVSGNCCQACRAEAECDIEGKGGGRKRSPLTTVNSVGVNPLNGFLWHVHISSVPHCNIIIQFNSNSDCSPSHFVSPEQQTLLILNAFKTHCGPIVPFSFPFKFTFLFVIILPRSDAPFPHLI